MCVHVSTLLGRITLLSYHLQKKAGVIRLELQIWSSHQLKEVSKKFMWKDFVDMAFP